SLTLPPLPASAASPVAPPSQSPPPHGGPPWPYCPSPLSQRPQRPTKPKRPGRRTMARPIPALHSGPPARVRQPSPALACDGHTAGGGGRTPNPATGASARQRERDYISSMQPKLYGHHELPPPARSLPPLRQARPDVPDKARNTRRKGKTMTSPDIITQNVIDDLDSFYCHNIVASLWADAVANRLEGMAIYLLSDELPEVAEHARAAARRLANRIGD